VSSFLSPLKNLFFPTTWRSNHGNPAFKSGEVNKLNKDWVPQNTSGDAAIAESWELSNARARDLVRNDPILSKSLNMVTALVIGSGIKTYCEAQDANRTYMEEFCEASDDDFEQWALEEADVTGRMTFYEMQELSFREMVTTGTSIWLEVMVNDSSRTSPLSYQLLETEQIDRTKDRPAARGQTEIRNGIELDRNGRAVAVWLYDHHPFEYGPYSADTLNSKRIPISRLIINFRPDRISSHIGITWLNCLAQVARDSDKFVANEITTRAVKALMTLFIKRASPGTGIANALSAEDVETQKSPVKMGYPAIVEIGQNDDIEVAESNGKSGADTGAFINMLLGQFAMGAGLSKHRLTGNASEANMASIRAGHIDDERITDAIQEHQINKIARKVRTRHQSIGSITGKYRSTGVSPVFFEANRRRLSKFFVIAAGDPDFQPKDDGEAAIDRMRSGRTSPQYEIARTGFYWRSVIRQTKQYLDELERNDLGPPDWTKGAGGTYLPFIKLEDQPVNQPPKSAASNSKEKAGDSA
jgi:lambda family phage portal protein